MMSETITYEYKLPKWNLSDEEAMALLNTLVHPGAKVYINNTPYHGVIDTRPGTTDVVIIVVRNSIEHRDVFKNWERFLEDEWRKLTDEYSKHVGYIQLYNATHGGCSCQKS